MPEFKLSASLEEHTDDVRAVAFASPDLIFSASRDATVRQWKLLSQQPPKHECSVSSLHTGFVNAVAFARPTKEYSEGLLIAGGKDAIIDVRQPFRPPEENAEALLIGHANNVCALDISIDGGYIVSGSWDSSARIWTIGKWSCAATLEGHEGSVWAVLAYDKDRVLTGCADQNIRLFGLNGKLLKEFKGTSDVVRTLCKLPEVHPSGAHFASAGNDGLIRLWHLDGRQVTVLTGHDNFIYSLACLQDGQLASCGEDRTVRIWDSKTCIQTITHPAISVWSVGVCAETGDIVTGASDKKVRVFTRDVDRLASAETIKDMEDAVKGSAIPQQQVGEVNKEKLPGPDFLHQKSGTKEGQVQMIREEDGSVTAHTWSQAAQQWVNVGTVVDAVGSSGKKTSYQGKEYDFVFDVDIEDGKPPLKLPYNLSQNNYEAATKFLQDNELPMTYLDQVANFITTNTKGATIGQSTGPSAADPWGSGSRYQPGEGNSASTPTPSASSRPKALPQTQYLSIKSANLKQILTKIRTLNKQLVDEGSKSIAFDEKALSALETSTTALEKALTQNTQIADFSPDVIQLVLTMITEWPPSHYLPALDFLRLLAASTPTLAAYRAAGGEDLISALESSGALADTDRINNIMLSVRTFSNLFETDKGCDLADNAYARICALVKSIPISSYSTNRNLAIAVATLWLNYSVLITSSSHIHLPSSSDRALELLDALCTVISTSPDSEANYRALVGIGTLLGLGEEMTIAAKEVYELEQRLKKVEGGVKEPRIRNVVGEIRDKMAGAGRR